jgi:unsaturated rhamnogalacturonyl hydrolase
MRSFVFLSVFVAAVCPRLMRAGDVEDANRFLDPLFRKSMVEGQVLTSCGVTRVGIPIRAIVDRELLDCSSSRCRILLVAGFSADDSVAATLAAVKWFHTSPEAGGFRKRFAVGAVPGVNSESLVYPQIDVNTAGGNPSIGYPPPGEAYGDRKNPESIYLWRGIGMLAPDLVVEIRSGRATIWKISPNPASEVDLGFAASLAPLRKGSSNRIATALVKNVPSGVAPIPAIEVTVVKGGNPLPELLRTLSAKEKPLRSPARKELLRRRDRTPIQVAVELSKVYGHNLNSVAYIPALALIGRCRLGELMDDQSHLADVERICEAYFSGKKPTMGKRVGGSSLSGHLVFGELAARTRKPKYLELASLAADLGFDENGEMKESMPFHSEMSDAVFMGTPILVQCGRLTGNRSYFDMAARHLEFMLKLNLREDGLHQHSPLDPSHTAWGRGNGFPALGLALCLTGLPEENRHRARFLEVYRNHMAAMKKHQDEMGMWHQVVDHPESYREFTVTCMTTFAMVRGLRNGWLKKDKYEPVVLRAWEAIKTRIGNDGHLVDVCTGTGKQKSFRDYLDRKAILGRDDRGGAMALMVSTEIAFAEREKAITLPLQAPAPDARPR